jgi:hypothetical protein
MKSKLWVSLFLLAVSGLVVSQHIYEEEFCPIIDDLREVDTIKVVNTFDHAKVAYFVDLHNSYQILVKASHMERAHETLNNIGIAQQNIPLNQCRAVNN